MNDYIIAHIINIKALVQNFEHSCEQSALKDDKKITPEEAKALKKIHKAVTRFTNDLDKIL